MSARLDELVDKWPPLTWAHMRDSSVVRLCTGYPDRRTSSTRSEASMMRTLIGTPDPPQPPMRMTVGSTTSSTAGTWTIVTFGLVVQPPLKHVQSERLDKPREIEP